MAPGTGTGTKIAVGLGTAAAAAAATAPEPEEEQKCNLPTGLTKDDAIQMVWYKVREDDYYPPVLTVQGTEYYRDDPANPRTLPLGEPIGVPRKYWPRLSKPPFQLLPEPRGTKADIFRELLTRRYGVDLEGLQIDHVQDLQWEGPDEFENMWPLSSSANLSAGPRQNNIQTVSFCETKKGPLRMNVSLLQVKAENRHWGRWFYIGRIER